MIKVTFKVFVVVYIVILEFVVALKRACCRCWWRYKSRSTRFLIDLLWSGVFSDSFCALTDGVLSKFTGEKKSDSCLDLTRGDGTPLVVVSKTASLGWDPLENVVHERIHDWHGFGWDPCIRVHLFQDFVDVDGVRFLPPPLLFLVAGAHGLSLAGFLSSFAWNFGWHVDGSVFLFNIKRRG